MKERVKAFSIDFVILLLACASSAFAVVSIMIPNGLTLGGITGIARILQKFMNINFSILYYGLSLIVLVLVVLFLGWKEVKKVLLLSVMYPAVLFVFEQLSIELLEAEDVLLGAVFCGVFTWGLSSGGDMPRQDRMLCLRLSAKSCFPGLPLPRSFCASMGLSSSLPPLYMAETWPSMPSSLR